MSSHDSMVLVFKCLSNGAVDFLECLEKMSQRKSSDLVTCFTKVTLCFFSFTYAFLDLPV